MLHKIIQKNKKKLQNLFVIYISFFLIFFPKTVVSSSTLGTKSEEAESEDKFKLSKYILGPGDYLKFILFDEDKFSGEYQILNDGSITFPIIGNVNLMNLSIDQATEKIKNLYSKQLLRPDLFLGISKARPIKVSIVGEIKRPGIYSLSSGSESEQDMLNSKLNFGLPSVIDAIQKAGGITQNSNLKEVILFRKIPGDETEYKKTKLNLIALIVDGNQIYNPFLFDGDVIKVKKVENPPSKFASIAKNNLNSKYIDIYVVGEVFNPGKITIASGTPLSQAILKSGGVIPLKSNKSNIELVRVMDNGTIKKNKFKFDLSQTISEQNNPILQDKDIVRVFPSKLESVSKGLNVIGSPLRDIVSVYSLLKIISD